MVNFEQWRGAFSTRRRVPGDMTTSFGTAIASRRT